MTLNSLINVESTIIVSEDFASPTLLFQVIKKLILQSLLVYSSLNDYQRGEGIHFKIYSSKQITLLSGNTYSVKSKMARSKTFSSWQYLGCTGGIQNLFNSFILFNFCSEREKKVWVKKVKVCSRKFGERIDRRTYYTEGPRLTQILGLEKKPRYAKFA